MKFSTLIAVVAPLFTITEAASGFTSTCRGDAKGPYRLCGVGDGTGGLQYPVSLCADCQKIDGSWQKSRLDLNKCIVNRDGVIYAQQDGGFGGSCGVCIITYAGRTDMECLCSGNNQRWEDFGPNGLGNLVELNDFIGNDNGVLRCFDRWGDKV